MKVAIPYWQGRVSPVFDVAAQVLVVEVAEGDVGDSSVAGGGGAAGERVELALDTLDACGRAERLSQAGVEVLICGALSCPQELALSAAGIEILAGTCGEIEQVLAAFIRDGLVREDFLMPGCCGRRRRGRRCRRGRNKHDAPGPQRSRGRRKE